MNSSEFVVGRGFSLLQTWYAQEFLLSRVAKESIVPGVNDVARLQDVCQRLNIAFVLLITPSKAAIYPEDIPMVWKQRYDASRPRAYEQLVELLNEKNIHYVDAHILTLAAKRDASVPVFPKGGIHWGQIAAHRAANALIDAFREQGKDLK